MALMNVPGWLQCIPVGVGYCNHDRNGCHPLFINDTLSDLFGKNKEDLAGILDGDLTQIIHPDDADRFRLILYKAGITGGTYRTKTRVLTASGDSRFMDIWLRSLPHADGTSLFCFLFTDINVQIASQQKLDNSYEKLLGVMDNAPGGIVVLDTINGKNPAVIFSSNGIDRLLRGSHEQLSAIYEKDLFAGVHPDDWEKATRRLEESVRFLSDFTTSLRLKTAQGDFIWVSISGSIEAIENRRIIYLSLLDSSPDHEFQLIQKAILDSFSRHQCQHICYIDGARDTFRFLASNTSSGIRAPEEGSGFDEKVARAIDRYVPQEERAQLKESITLENIFRQLADKDDVEYLYTLTTPDGSMLRRKAWFSWVDKRKRTLALVVSDHTREFLREEQSRVALSDALRASEQASVAKSEFLSRMSHDIRTPLNAIIGFTEMGLEDQTISVTERDRLSKISSSSKFLLSLINEVLDMSRIESGKLTLNEHAFSLPEFVDEITAIIEPQCAEKGVRYECAVRDGSCASFVGDSLKMQQIFINMLGNAVKFTPEGGTVSFVATQTKRFENHAILEFHVDDTGQGISKDFLPHIFETFSQDKRDWTNESRGTGLGLAICHNLVAMMNGEIHVDSEPGDGTRFTVELPLKVVDAIPGEVQPSAEAHVQARTYVRPDLSGRHVLLAEDNAMNMEIARYLLEKVGLSVELARDGKAAYDLFAASPEGSFDAVVTDIVMPRMDGREVAEAIRALDRKDATSIPIIAMSADAFEEDVRSSLVCGINAYVVKPIDERLLYQTLARYL